MPVEVERAIPFAEDTEHASYDPAAAQLFWRQLVQADRVMSAFRARFVGKVSPVHFFWGAMDLAVHALLRPPRAAPSRAARRTAATGSWSRATRTSWPAAASGRAAARRAPSTPTPTRSPRATRAAAVTPAEAFYSAENRQFLLPYEAVRTAADPDATLLGFLQTTYDAAADLGGWDRAALDYRPVAGARP